MTTKQPAEGDTALMGLIADFHKAHARATAGHDKWITAKDRAEALPECPTWDLPASNRARYDRWEAFMEKQGVHALCALSTMRWEDAGRTVNAVFATEAKTFRGAVEKLKIAYLATGDGDGTLTGDEDLEGYQDLKPPG